MRQLILPSKPLKVDVIIKVANQQGEIRLWI